jgi:endonuclease-3 related protein
MESLISHIYTILLESYGPQGWWPLGGSYFPRQENPLEITIGAVLTQNTSWKNASMAIEELRKRGLLSAERILSTSHGELASIIRPSGYYNQKADRLKSICRFFNHTAASSPTPTREALLSIRGIGPETADSILLYAYHVPVFVIDAFTRRIFSRVGLALENMSYDEVQHLFMQSLPRDERLFNEYHALIVRHAKEVCRKMPQCTACVLAKEHMCAYARETGG